MKKYIILVFVLFIANLAQAKLTIANIFSDNMVLQRDRDVAVFGLSSPNAEVSVEFSGQTAKTKADADGKWVATLKPMKASTENRVMKIVDSEGDKIEFKNILVGEVWLCSGQSNMDCPIWGTRERYRAENGGLHIQLANNKNIRFFTVPKRWNVAPLNHISGKWSTFTSDSKDLPMLSACAAFFGKQIQESLGVPVGLISANWGGTRIEPWTPRCGFESKTSLQKILDGLKNLKKGFTPEEKEKMKKKNIRIHLNQQPTVIYNAMLNPIAPYTMRGAIWYQGCSNLGQANYAELMHALYNGWTKKFNNPDLQFYFAQLAPFIYGKADSQTRLAKSWEQQRKFAKEQTNARMILTNDIGDLYDIHPYDKQTVGLRFAALALQHTYAMKNIKADFPSIKSAKIDADKVIMEFDNVKKFYVRSRNRPEGDKLKFLEIAGDDGKFITADVQIKDATLIASTKSVSAPKFVRFLYAPKSQCNVFNEYGLPLDAFNIKLK